MSATSIGLYYPFINFRDENWLKVALLYWDKVSRIIPRGYENNDGESVRMIRRELGAIVDSHPDDAPPAVTREFRELILQEASSLRKKYDVTRSHNWKPDAVTLERPRRDADPRFAYVFDEKMGRQIAPLLIHERLAFRGEATDMRWIGLHPDLAGIYMTLLAEGIAQKRGFRLLSDSVTRHISIGDLTAERLATITLGRRAILGARPEEVERAVAIAAIRTVVPRNLDAVPMSAIIKLRKTYRNELREFQGWVQKMAEDLGKQAALMSFDDLKIHLSVLTEKQIKPRMEDLKAQLRTLGIEAATSVVNVKTIGGSGLATFLGQPFIGGSWISFSAASQLAKHQREAKRLVASNPAAYLLLSRENLRPAGVVKRVTRAVRRFSLRT